MRIMRVATAAGVFSLGFLGLQSAPASADSTDAFNSEAIDCFALYNLDCAHAQDAQLWARDVAAWVFPEHAVQHNDMADAFRHCVWIGALATRVGQQDAYTVGFMHEEYAEDNPSEEYAMDDWNNFIGSMIGEDAVNAGVEDEWGHVLAECESRARSYELYGLDGVLGNY